MRGNKNKETCEFISLSDRTFHQQTSFAVNKKQTGPCIRDAFDANRCAAADGELIFRFILPRLNRQSIRAAPPWQRNAIKNRTLPSSGSGEFLRSNEREKQSAREQRALSL